ncbi:MAG: H-NS histone family protein [Magnetococcales bacterium]|nr:H-NS histone family protein [Magnetococcales bacterium]
MADFDLDKMSIKDLKELVHQAEAKIKEKSSRGREEALNKFKEIAEEYGLTVEAVMGLEKTAEKKHTGAIPTRSLTQLMNIAPNGLYNPQAPKGKRAWKKDESNGRWMPITGWVKTELMEIRDQNAGEIPAEALEKLAKKYPAK